LRAVDFSDVVSAKARLNWYPTGIRASSLRCQLRSFGFLIQRAFDFLIAAFVVALSLTRYGLNDQF